MDLANRFSKLSIFAITLLSITILVGLLGGGEPVEAHAYDVRLDTATWNVEPSRLECRLWQGVPTYGRAVFARRAGSNQRFFLSSRRKVVTKGKAVLESQAPEWIHNVKTTQLGVVDAALGEVPLLLQHHLTTRLLDELENGMSPLITHPGWSRGHKVQVKLTAVNFGEAYESYLDCGLSLLPHNFDQLERTSIYFDSGMTYLHKKFKVRMNELANYINYDVDVLRFVIDGHTDNVGRTGANWDLSQLRAQKIKDYLLSIGIAEEMILLRYHGETRPKVKNNNRSNRASNRRVTIRLDKELETPGEVTL